MIEKILELMKSQNVTAAKLTKETNLPNSAITEWKKGKSKPSLDAIVKIADYFNVSVDYILGRANTEPSAQTEIASSVSRAGSPHIVAYIDFLGVKNLINSDKSHYIDDISKAYGAMLNLLNILSPRMDELYPGGFKTKIFSDNILIATKYNENDIANALHKFCIVIALFQRLLLGKYRLSIRGAICMENLYFDDVFTCGKALLDSYNLESKIAYYPRIIVSKNLISYLGDTDFVIADFDYEYFINYIPPEKEYIDETIDTALYIYNQIKQNTDLKVLQKLYWQKGYYVRVLLSMIKKCTNTDSTQKIIDTLVKIDAIPHTRSTFSDSLDIASLYKTTPLYGEVAAHNDEKAYEEKPEITPETTPPQK